MRLFVGIALPPAVATRLAQLLPSTLPALRRTHPDLMHVTLAFIGALPEERLPDVVSATAAAVRERTTFIARLDQLGRFPPAGRPKIVWVGVSTGAAQVLALGDSVRAALAARGVPYDAKPLQPHVTLARVRAEASLAESRTVAAAVEAAVPARAELPVAAVTVYESILSPRGARYVPRQVLPLPEH